MKEKDVIKQIQLLQSVQPGISTKRAIHKKVVSRIVAEKSVTFWNRLFVSPLISIAILTAVIVLIIGVSEFFSGVLDGTITDFKISMATNQYEKAKIALSYLDGQIANTHGKTPEGKNLLSLSYALTTANTQMSELKLVGEKGKYTSKQCLELYESYNEDLKNLASNQEQNVLDSQVQQDETQSENKLRMYSQKYKEDIE